MGSTRMSLRGRMRGRSGGDRSNEALVQLDLFESSLRIARSRFQNLESYMAIYPCGVAGSGRKKENMMRKRDGKKKNAYFASLASQTVEKRPQPSLKTIV